MEIGVRELRNHTARVIDASVFVARESGRPLGQLPEQVAVSVVTIGELYLGVLAATDASTRARRANTLSLAAGDPLPISEAVKTAWARLAGAHPALDVVQSDQQECRSRAA